MSEPQQTQYTPEDPRSVSDQKVREEHTREEVERWRQEAQAQHLRWMEVAKNNYGKD